MDCGFKYSTLGPQNTCLGLVAPSLLLGTIQLLRKSDRGRRGFSREADFCLPKRQGGVEGEMLTCLSKMIEQQYQQGSQDFDRSSSAFQPKTKQHTVSYQNIPNKFEPGGLKQTK